MLTKLLTVIHTEKGKYAMSIILGIGLASLFRKVCKDRNCMIFQAPPLAEVTSTVYKHGSKCYKFTEKSTKCGTAPRTVSFA